METPGANYFKSEICDLYTIGDINDRFYALAFSKAANGLPSNLKETINKRLLSLQESGKLAELKLKWFGTAKCHKKVCI